MSEHAHCATSSAASTSTRPTAATPTWSTPAPARSSPPRRSPAPQDVDRALRRGAPAPSRPGGTPRPAERQRALLKIADAVEARADELVALESRNTGKPLGLTASEELPPMVDQIRFFAGAARHAGGPGGRRSTWPGTPPTSGASRSAWSRQVTPWNYPMMMAVWKFAPAIAAGNTVVLKPSDTTPVTTLLLAEIAAEFLPPGVFNVVCGDRDTGRALVAHPTPQMVSITGSTRAGHAGGRSAAAPTVKRVHLELGGKAPVVVFDDADIAAAAEGIAVAGYFNAGQDCTAATRVLVAPRHPRRLRRRAHRAGPRTRPRRGGAGRRRTLYVPPVNNANQLGPGHRLPRPACPTTPRSPPAAHRRRRARATSRADRRRRAAPGRRDHPATRCSARSSPCSGSPTRTRRCAGPTASSYGLASSVWTKRPRPRACG